MKVYPCLRYRDASAAIDFLQRAFGMELASEHHAADGTIAHAELTWGDTRVMLGTDGDDGPFGSRAGMGWVYATCDDPDALFARAKDAGAEVAYELTDTDYGSRDFSVRDLEGNLWSFGTYEP